MAQINRELEITALHATIPCTGSGIVTTTSHLLTAELVWPRIGIAKKSTTYPCKLVRGVLDFSTLDWSVKTLFKEKVSGSFALRMTLTEALDDEALEKILRITTSAAITVGTSYLSSLLPLIWGGIAKAPLNALAKEIGKYPGPTLLAEGELKLEAGELPLSGGEVELNVEMRAARRIIRTSRKTVNSKPRVTRSIMLEEGDPNGEIKLNLRSL